MSTACSPARLRTKITGELALISSRWNQHRSTNHRFGLTLGHDSSMRTSSRRSRCKSGKRLLVFQGRRPSFAPSVGCESAQSAHRPSLRRPGAPAGCSRCERSPDTAFACAASSRVVPPTSRRRYLGHAFRLAVAAMLIRFRNPSSQRVTFCAASTSSMRTKPLPCLLIAPSRCRPPELRSRGISPR